ncbi:ATP-binding protein [Planctomycetota bacterium]
MNKSGPAHIEKLLLGITQNLLARGADSPLAAKRIYLFSKSIELKRRIGNSVDNPLTMPYNPDMLRRNIESSVRELAKGYPALAITGPRQSGKTTLARAIFPDKPYVLLKDPDTRDLAESDPRGFLSKYKAGAILDEVQYCPNIISYLQGIIDETASPGRFILTGSQQYGLLSGITESLAGRIALVVLLPFSLSELYHDAEPPSLDTVLFQGMYPPIHDRHLDPTRWYANYVDTYLERDVRNLLNVRDITTFRRFVRLCAGRTGQLLNLSELGSDAGISHNTAKAWISILEASYVLHLLPPHHRNFNKRMIKSPKLYFFDSGLAAYLLGIQETAQLDVHPQRGALFETAVVSELMKARLNKGLRSNLYFWRDRSGHEVDMVIESGGSLIPVEIKSGQTVVEDSLAGLRYWSALAGTASASAFMIYGGDTNRTQQDIQVLSWKMSKTLHDAV